MKLNMKPRCHRCRFPIPGNSFHGDGKEFCSRSCCEFHIIDAIARQSRFRTARFKSPWWVVIAILGMMLSMAITDKAMGHDIYHQWQRSDGKGSCCNGRKITDGVETGDCAPAASRFDGQSWWAKHNGYWIKVPDDKIIREKNPTPEIGHLCINPTGTILCYVPPNTGS